MDNSLSQYELSDSTVKLFPDSEDSSEKSETLEELALGDTDQSSNDSDSGKMEVSEDFDNNLPETVTLLTHEPTGAKIYLIGTAHFSKKSQEDVEKVFSKVVPNVVVLELCRARTNILSLNEEKILEEAKNLDLQKIIAQIKSNGLYNGFMYLLLLNMSVHMTRQTGMAPGGEFRTAYKEALKVSNCTIELGDRPIDITLQRALSKLNYFQLCKVIWHLITSNENISTEDIEKCKQSDILEQLMEEFAGQHPVFREVLLDERDIYLTHSLKMVAFKTYHENIAENCKEPINIIGVVGIGHVPGIVKLWYKDLRHLIPGILDIPPPSLSSIIVKYTLKISFLTFGGYLIYRFIPVPTFLKDSVHLIVSKVINNTNKTMPDMRCTWQ